MPASDPRDRVVIATLAALTRHSRCDGAEATAAARRAANVDRFERLVDPDRVLTSAERARRAEIARRAHMVNLARKSAKARRTRAGGQS